MGKLFVYNTLTRKKEEFIPWSGNEVKMYACGITVSGDAHIGHFLQAMVYDIIRKYIKKKGYEVSYARNYTDIDDKIIASANKSGISTKKYAEQKIKKIDSEMKRAQVDDPDVWLKATSSVGDIIDFVQELINKGNAYSTPNGDVYFAVNSFPEYGKLSNRNLEDAENGVRIENDENKKNPLDFVLWKASKEGEPSWESPWGAGRPGWHIECSAMNKKAFGEQIDIHGGGRDLIFPHHENEIAQTEALTGKKFVKYWTHNGLIKVNGQKMSKSLGNSIVLEELLNKYNPEVIKFALLQTNYRNDINVTDSLFDEAEKHVYNFHKTLAAVDKMFGKNNTINEDIERFFDDAMDDDFNTPKAIANLHAIFKVVNEKIRNEDKSVVADVNGVRKAYALLGLFVNNSEDFITQVDAKKEVSIPKEVISIAEERLVARKNKDWQQSDVLRNKIQELGYDVQDNKDGYELRKR